MGPNGQIEVFVARPVDYRNVALAMPFSRPWWGLGVLFKVQKRAFARGVHFGGFGPTGSSLERSKLELLSHPRPRRSRHTDGVSKRGLIVTTEQQGSGLGSWRRFPHSACVSSYVLFSGMYSAPCGEEVEIALAEDTGLVGTASPAVNT